MWHKTLNMNLASIENCKRSIFFLQLFCTLRTNIEILFESVSFQLHRVISGFMLIKCTCVCVCLRGFMMNYYFVWNAALE